MRVNAEVYKLINRGKVAMLLAGGWTCVVGLVLSLGPATCRHIFLQPKDHPTWGTSLVWLEERYWYDWPNLKLDSIKYVMRCRICKLSKGRSQATILYTLFPISKETWGYFSMYLISGLLYTPRGNDFRFTLHSKMWWFHNFSDW